MEADIRIAHVVTDDQQDVGALGGTEGGDKEEKQVTHGVQKDTPKQGEKLPQGRAYPL
ncbi:hypothetical protein LBMAG55_11070 [Verrucomicrobiota bacterium]|nr:hypothetical protein LBMAG55_11070 [Verrucomicrobiota bacterium]